MDFRLCSACIRHATRRSPHILRAGRREYSYSSRGQLRRSSNPIDTLYDDLMRQKRPMPQTRTAPAAPPKEALPKTDQEETLQKARVVFGSRLAGPINRRREIEQASRNIAGVLVPPRPGEPDNCCMSGCVNCVWDQYRDELEEWAEKRAEADRRLAMQRSSETQARRNAESQPGQAPSHVFHSMDDDGGGSDTNWDLGPPSQSTAAQTTGDLFADIPVGIREFMRTEKRLKQSKQMQAAAA